MKKTLKKTLVYEFMEYKDNFMECEVNFMEYKENFKENSGI